MKQHEAIWEYFFAFPHPFAQPLIKTCKRPWEIVPRLHECFSMENLSAHAFKKPAYNIWAEDGAVIEGGAIIEGRLIVGAGTVIRHNAVIRGDVVVGRHALIGNFTEVKNALLYDGVQLPHLSYVGDSVLGQCAHLGAGAKISNYKSFGTPIDIVFEEGRAPALTDKFGAILGDEVEVGCNAVVNPGGLLGKRCVVYPLLSFRGTADEGTVIKSLTDTCSRQ